MTFVTLLPVYVSGLAKAGDDGFNVTWGSCNEQFVIEIQHGRAVNDIGGGCGSVYKHTRDDKISLRDFSYLAHGSTDNLLILHAYGEWTDGQFFSSTETSLGCLFFLTGMDAKDILQEKEDKYGADNTDRIGGGITGGNAGVVYSIEVAVGLLSSSQSRRIGHSTRQDTCHGGDRSACGIEQNNGDNNAYRDGRYGKHIEPETTFAKRGEETWTYLEAERIDEENQAKLLEEVEQMLVKIKTEITKGNSDKQYPSQSQRNVGDFDLAQ